MSAPLDIVLIAAVARNGVIGRDNTLPWRLKADLAHFKAHTSGHPIIMGRKTWDSLGRPLPKRRNMVVTRNTGLDTPGAEVFSSPQAALGALESGTVFIIGGADLYRQCIGQANRLLITEVMADIDGDACFPDIDPELFEETGRDSHKADADNEYSFDFVEYQRRG